PEIYTLSLHDALPICGRDGHAIGVAHAVVLDACSQQSPVHADGLVDLDVAAAFFAQQLERILRHDATVPQTALVRCVATALLRQDRKSTRLNSSHQII